MRRPVDLLRQYLVVGGCLHAPSSPASHPSTFRVSSVRTPVSEAVAHAHALVFFRSTRFKSDDALLRLRALQIYDTAHSTTPHDESQKLSCRQAFSFVFFFCCVPNNIQRPAFAGSVGVCLYVRAFVPAGIVLSCRTTVETQT